MTTMCACGRPLHYNSRALQRMIEDLSKEGGEDVEVYVSGIRVEVQRHFIALHGIKAQDLLRYGVEGVYRRAGVQ